MGTGADAQTWVPTSAGVHQRPGGHAGPDIRPGGERAFLHRLLSRGSDSNSVSFFYDLHNTLKNTNMTFPVWTTSLLWIIRVDSVAEGGRRFTTAWREEEVTVDAARHRQEKRESTRLGKLLSRTEA